MSSNVPSVTMCYFYNLFFFHLFLYEHEEIKVLFSAFSGGSQHIYTAFEKKVCSGTNVLIKIHEVIKGKVNRKRLFCFNYVQVSSNRELFIKVSRS